MNVTLSVLVFAEFDICCPLKLLNFYLNFYTILTTVSTANTVTVITVKCQLLLSQVFQKLLSMFTLTIKYVQNGYYAKSCI